MNMTTRKNIRKVTCKVKRNINKTTQKHSGGKSEWLKRVMRVYKYMKAKNPNTHLGDAMKAAKNMNAL